MLTVSLNKIKSVKKHLLLAFFAFVVCFYSNQSETFAQGDPAVIQMSGIIVDGDSSYGVPGVHIYIMRAGLGTVSNPVGYFSLPTMVGDTVIFSAVGYEKQRLIVPDIRDKGFTVLIDLQTDTTFLPIIEVFPYPTEELFKEAFLALELPVDERQKNMEKNLNQQALNRMAASIGMDGGSNHRYYMDQQATGITNQFFAPSFSILNPFAWGKFIESVKRGDLKKKD
ncbi:carboxypeptidase-like regulatory domain-containing protein [Flexithrix dorotheae]|uniref:carboxypeptidase-like regulatory domain-containing protein n=1 Tax=Flexithrix dorotheae TaxID=70993 RepID=UPI0012F8AF6C|nr:carboxypeptidase-like regulatory domain-containing protein [Flexithrix dorotheae]